jgi:hypothetical protein
MEDRRYAKHVFFIVKVCWMVIRYNFVLKQKSLLKK